MNATRRKWISILLAGLLLISGLTVPASAGTQTNTPVFVFTVQPGKAEYAADEEVEINTKLFANVLADIYDIDIVMSYSRSDTYLAAGTAHEYHALLEYGDMQYNTFTLVRNDATAQAGEKLGSLLGSLLQRLLHLISQLSPYLKWAGKVGDRLHENFSATLKSLFAPRKCEELGTCSVVYDGEEITCRFKAYYREAKRMNVPAAERAAQADSAFSLTATAAPDASALSGLYFGAELGADAVSGGFFFLDAANHRAGLAQIDGESAAYLAVKNIPIEAGKTYSIRLDYDNGRIAAWVYTDAAEADGLPLFDVETAFSGADVGFCGHVTDFAVGEAPAAFAGETYTNPLYENSADPFVLYDDGAYYLYATNSGRGFNASKSLDLVHWEPVGRVADKDDIVGDSYFWAPEVYKYNGKYYLLYSAEKQLAIAVADSPVGPFVKTSDSFLFDFDGIDGHIFFDDDGKIYVYLSVSENGGTGIWGYEMNDDLISVKYETGQRLSAPGGWEKNINEGPFMLKHNGVYYLTYSGSYYTGNYAVGYMTSDSPLGTFTKYELNPILKSDAFIRAPGHHCFAYSPDGSELFMVYHCHYSATQGMPRRLCIDRAEFVPDASGTDRLVVHGPTATPQPVPSK